LRFNRQFDLERPMGGLAAKTRISDSPRMLPAARIA
jgi:hypothetical protein